MAKFKVPLNGSNFVSQDRQQAFKNALDDDHQIECQDDQQLIVSDRSQPTEPSSIPTENPLVQAPTVQAPQRTTDDLQAALEHTFSHQNRTMEIHQQYLAQQTEYIQLITSVLEQQGKVIDQGNGSPNGAIIETFQRTLDNFHAIREQGLRVHQDFLAKQNEFSQRYLDALEGRSSTSKPLASSTPAPSSPPHAETQAQAPASWVVKEPPIVLVDRRPQQEAPQPASEPLPSEPLRASVSDSTPDSIDSKVLADALLRIVAEKTGYPAEMLELEMDLEADLGIDSIKRVEILGTLEEEFPTLPPADTEILAQTRTLQEIINYLEEETSSEVPQAQNTPSPAEIVTVSPDKSPASVDQAESSQLPGAAELTTILMEIVAEKTGYPVEMLEPEMDMEADLGIDSIKRVEILGTMEEQVPGLPAVEAEALAELRTLGQIVDLMGSATSVSPTQATEEPEAKKKVDPEELRNTPVKLVPLAAPDHLELNPDPERPVIVTSDGSPLTTELVSRLKSDGWNIIVWHFPTLLVDELETPLSEDVQQVHQPATGQESIQTQYRELKENSGSPAGFIHLHPTRQGDLFSDSEEELIKQVFLLAGEMKADLTVIPSTARSFYLTVTRSDGHLGTRNGTTFQEGSGLTGLAKSLHWEWPDVFCRAVDLDQSLPDPTAAELLLGEVHDPDRGLLEVGLTETKRTTINREDPNQ